MAGPAREAQPRGLPPCTADQPHRRVGCPPGVRPPIPNRSVLTISVRLLSAAARSRETAKCAAVRGMARTQARRCAARRPGVVVLCLAAPAASHRMADWWMRADELIVTIAPTRQMCRQRARRALPASTPDDGSRTRVAWPIRGAFAACARRWRVGAQVVATTGQAAIGKVISRSSWPISRRRQRMRGP
jgi:hypothetical protein